MLLTLERYISPENEQEVYYSISGRPELADFWIGILGKVLAKWEFSQIRKGLNSIQTQYGIGVVFCLV